MLEHFFTAPPEGTQLVQGSYHFGLVFLSVFVAVILSLLSLRMTEQAQRTHKTSFRTIILFTGAVALGSGIWTMHFIGMFAFELPAPVSYNPQNTIASMFPAAIAAWIALAMLAQPQISRKQLVFSSVIMGAGIGTMHYGGMLAIETPLTMRHDPWWFLLSVVVAVVLAMISIGINFGLQRFNHGRRARFWLSGIVMGCAIAGMHYTAMQSVEFYGTATQANSGLTISTFYIALALSSVSLTIAVTVAAVNGLVFAQELNAKANAAKQRLVAIFDTAVDAIITINPQGIVEEFSNSAETMFGYRHAEVVGKNIKMLMPEPYRSEHDGYLARYLATRQPKILGVGVEAVAQRKDGSVFPMRLSVGEVNIGDGELLFVGLIADITKYKTLENSLREEAEKAQQAAIAKSNFLANMSHEIRTPMNAIIGFTELLLQGELNEQQRNQLNTVRQSSRSLLGLLNDILDTSKLESGKFELEIANFSLKVLAAQIESTLSLGAQAKGLALKVNYPASMPEYFQGDSLRILQVLTNLVGNAIKFTEQGSVNITFNYEQGQVHIQVRDTGIGMSPEQTKTIFDAFTQADASISRRFGGTGLGTTISKQLIDTMQGRIEVESELGVGSAFHIWLPLDIGEKTVEAQALSHQELPALNILIVDDIEQNRELLSIILLNKGHQVTKAVNGQDAYEKIQENSFDLVLMDVHMPVVDGLKATRMVRELEQQEQRARLPIIALTASVMASDRKIALQSGMDGFAVKPIDIPQLFNELGRVLAGQALDEEAILSTVNKTDIIDWQRGASLWGNQDKLIEQIAYFLEHLDEKYPLPMQQPIQKDVLAFSLHGLKGAAGNLGLMQLAQQAAKLEELVTTERWPQLELGVEQLTSSVHGIRQTLQEQQTTTAANPSTQQKLTLEQSQILLQQLQTKLEHSEIDDNLLQQLRHVPTHLCANVEKLLVLVNDFEFAQAQSLITQILKAGKES